MRTGNLAAVIGLAVSVLFAAVGDTYRSYEELKENVLRLHIIANSDSEEDQRIKLEVRDRIAAQSEDIFGGCESREEILRRGWESLDIMEETAQEVLTEGGFGYGAEASIEQTYFDTRYYGEITMPQGDYTALKITLGEGKGHNWWCVMYPPLCLPCFTESEEDTDEILEKHSDVITEQEAEIMKDPESIEVRLYCAEIIDRIVEFLKGDE